MNFDDYAMRAKGEGRRYWYGLSSMAKASVLRAFIADDNCNEGDLLCDLVCAVWADNGVDSSRSTARAFQTLDAILSSMPYHLDNRYEDLIDVKNN